MKVSRERLSVIGKLIGIYREERRGNSQNNYTIRSFCDGICSPNTLKSIEAGGLSRSEYVYEELLAKLGLKFGEFPVIDEVLKSITSKLKEYIEYYDVDKVKTICEKTIRILYEVKEFVYYSELYSAFMDISNYYVNDLLLDSERVSLYTMFIKKEVFDFNDILKNVLFAKIKTLCVINYQTYIDIVKIMKIGDSTLSCTKLNLLHYYLVVENYLEMGNLIRELEVVFEKEKNYIRLIDTYNYAIVLYSYIGKNNLDKM